MIHAVDSSREAPPSNEATVLVLVLRHGELRIRFEVVGRQHIHPNEVPSKAIVAVGLVAGDGTPTVRARGRPAERHRRTGLAATDLGQGHHARDVGGRVQGHATALPGQRAGGIVHTNTWGVTVVVG